MYTMRSVKQLSRIHKSWVGCNRLFSTTTQTTDDNKGEGEEKLGGYAKAFTKFENIPEKPAETPKTFAALLKNSKFIDLGDPEGKIVIGKITHVVGDDLYIDFGWKFHCVCGRPEKFASNYVRGAKVRLLVRDLELSSKFLGYEKDLTLLEADCTLLGLVQDRSSITQTNVITDQ